MKQSIPKQKLFEKTGAYIVLLIGFVAAAIQFFSERSFWLDESSLALNIIKKTPVELFKPLDNYQVAPILFLQIESLFSHVFTNQDLALRLFPFLCFVCSLFLFYKILVVLFKNGYIIVFGLALFAFNSTMIYYSSEAKQYICDIFVLLLLYYFLLKNYRVENNRYLLILLTGSVSVFLSNITPVVLFTVGVYLVYDYLFNNKGNFKHLIVLSGTWCLCFLVCYYFFYYNHPTKAYMLTYWTNANAFMPFNKHIFNWFAGRYGGMFFFGFYFGNKIGVVISILYFFGVLSLFKLKKHSLAILALVPLLIHLILSGLKLYPFESRLYLYLCPLVIITICTALNYFDSVVTNRYISIPLFLCLPFFLLRIIAIHPLPVVQHDDVKDCIKEMNSRFLNNDQIYVTNLMTLSLKYYRETNFLKLKDTIIYGYYTAGAKERDCNIARLKALKGRIWVISQKNELNGDSFVTHYLDSAGYKKAYSFTSIGNTSAVLYNSGSK